VKRLRLDADLDIMMQRTGTDAGDIMMQRTGTDAGDSDSATKLNNKVCLRLITITFFK